MENTNWIDITFGIVALLIVLSGLFFLFQGTSAINKSPSEKSPGRWENK